MKYHYSKKKNRNQNAGFTLVEVLIAMTILALIAAPLLHTFVTAARTNAKARKVMQSTTVAQNIMEELKAYSLEDIARDMNGLAKTGDLSKVSSIGGSFFEAYKDPSDANVFKRVDARTVTDGTLATGSNPSSVTGIYKTESGTATLKDVKFTGQSKTVGGVPVSEYNFVLGDIHVGGSPNSYDAVVTVTADPSTAIANISSMNRSDCAYYVQPATEVESIVAEYWNRHQSFVGIDVDGNHATTITQSTFNDLITRKMNIEYDGASVTVSYEYDCGSGYTSDADRRQENSTIVYNSYISGEELNSIYVYYYPLYASYSSVCRDRFTVTNTSEKEVTVYLIKMVDVTNYSTMNEANYRMDLHVNDMETSGLNAVSDQLTEVCANIAEANLNTVDFNTVNTGNEKALIKNLGNSSNQYVKYSIVIDVYEHKDGSFTDVNTFSPVSADAQRYTSFTGSKVDNSSIED